MMTTSVYLDSWARRSSLFFAAAIAVSVALLGLGAYGLVSSQGGGAPILPYRIAFSSTRQGEQRIYVLDRDGSQERLTDGDGADQDPAWSPDGKQLAFARTGQSSAIYVRDDEGTHQVSQHGPVGTPRWSPDGSRIAYSLTQEGAANLGLLWIMNADGQAQSPVFGRPDASATRPDCFGEFVGGWYPQGDRILYRGSWNGTLAICSVKTDGSDVRVIVEQPNTLNFAPSLSPDGTQIAFVSNRDGRDQIYIAKVDGNDTRRLIADNAKEEDPAWSPDGQQIAFSSNRDEHYHIYTVRTDGTGPTQLTSGDSDDMYPAWSPG